MHVRRRADFSFHHFHKAHPFYLWMNNNFWKLKFTIVFFWPVFFNKLNINHIYLHISYSLQNNKLTNLKISVTSDPLFKKYWFSVLNRFNKHFCELSGQLLWMQSCGKLNEQVIRRCRLDGLWNKIYEEAWLYQQKHRLN